MDGHLGRTASKGGRERESTSSSLTASDHSHHIHFSLLPVQLMFTPPPGLPPPSLWTRPMDCPRARPGQAHETAINACPRSIRHMSLNATL